MFVLSSIFSETFSLLRDLFDQISFRNSVSFSHYSHEIVKSCQAYVNERLHV